MYPGIIASIFLILFGLMEFFLRRGATAKSVKAGSADRGTTLLIFGSYTLTIFVLSIHIPGIVWIKELCWLGVGCSALGTLLRIWSMTTLGRYYTRTLVTTTEQTVVQNGPYRYIRHPGYLSALLIWVGATVASGSVSGTVLVLMLLNIAYIYRIKTEEQMLIETFGTAYSDYQQRTWRLIPFIY